MMKKMFSSKKTMAIVAMIVLLAVAAGATYAYFTWESGKSATAKIGRLVTESALGVDDAIYEPGDTISAAITLKNKGNLASTSLLKLDENMLTIRSDANGKALPEEDWYQIPADPDLYKAAIDEDKIVTFIDIDNDTAVIWLKHKATGQYLVMMEGAAETAADYVLDIDGLGVGNEAQGALLSYSANWLSTQTRPEAVQVHLGVDIEEMDDFEILGLDEGDSVGRSANTLTREQVIAKINELIGK